MEPRHQTFLNRLDEPIYISIEPYPECYELEPGERMTLIYESRDNNASLDVEVINGRELVIWPPENVYEWTVLIDGVNAKERNWNFKHLQRDNSAASLEPAAAKPYKSRTLLDIMLRRP